MASGAPDPEVGDGAEEASGLLRKPVGPRRRHPPRLVPALCLVGAGALALALTGRATALPPRVRSDGVAGLSEAGAKGYARITWAPHPHKCLVVKRGKQGGTVGAVPVIEECSSTSDTFVVPPPGQTGPIKWASYPELCLDAPRGSELQFWDCAKAPQENTRFTMPSGSRGGPIQLAARPGKCINVPDHEDRAGVWLDIWDCRTDATAQHDVNMDFVALPAASPTNNSIATVTCYVQNLEYERLLADQALFRQFDAAVKGGMADAVRGGILPGQVALTSSAGAKEMAGKSVNVNAIIALGKAAHDPELASRLKSSNGIARTLAGMPELERAAEGPIAVACHRVRVHL